jgi:uncharacterized protein (TIGR00725 family)
MVHRIAIVGVMGSGASAHAERAAPVGRWLAELGVHLLTGGGGGVMAAVSKAFCQTQPRLGNVIGIIPSGDDAGHPKPGYPNPWVEIPILTHLALSGTQGSDPLSRNHINVLSSDVIVALPGGAGTASEARLALAYRRPIVAFVSSGAEIPGLPDQVPCAASLDEVAEFVRARLGGRLSGG